MSDSQQLAQDFITALSLNDAARYERILRGDAGIRVWGAQRTAIHRPRARVV